MTNRAISWDNDFGGDRYRDRSDEVYRRCLQSGGREILRHHNLVTGAEKEIGFALALSRVFFGSVPEGRALDVGCGWGLNTSCLQREFGFEAVGFDINEDAIGIARKSFPGIEFFVADGTSFPAKNRDDGRFDLIYCREFHPFTRIADFDYQRGVLKDYLSLLNDQGLMVIAHARSGGGMDYPSLDFKRIRDHFKNEPIATAGPFLFFLFRHLGLTPGSKGMVKLISSATSVVQSLTRQRWIEFFLLFRSS